MGALPPGESDLHCLLRPCAKVYHLLKRHDCILNRDHCDLERHTRSASFHCHGCFNFRGAELREVFIPSTVTLERGSDKYARARQKETFCSSNAGVGSLDVLARMVWNRSEKWAKLFFSRFCISDTFCYLQMTFEYELKVLFTSWLLFSCRMRWGRRKHVFKKNQKLIFLKFLSTLELIVLAISILFWG